MTRYEEQSHLRQRHPTPVLLPGKSHGQRAWWAVVHGVDKSRIRLSDFTSLYLHVRKQSISHLLLLPEKENQCQNLPIRFKATPFSLNLITYLSLPCCLQCLHPDFLTKSSILHECNNSERFPKVCFFLSYPQVQRWPCNAFHSSATQTWHNKSLLGLRSEEENP